MLPLYEFLENVVYEKTLRSLIFYASMAIVLYRIPLIDKVLRTIHTLLHETGHVVMTVMTSGKIHRVELHSNLSGVTITESSNKFRQFLISIAGYPFASASGWFAFWLIFNGYAHEYLFGLSGVIFLILMSSVRNMYGIIWSLLIIASFMLVIYNVPQFVWAVSVLAATITVIESAWMSGVICVIAFKSPQNAGDPSNLFKLTGIHSVFWGFIFFAQAAFFAYMSVLLAIEWIDKLQ